MSPAPFHRQEVRMNPARTRRQWSVLLLAGYRFCGRGIQAVCHAAGRTATARPKLIATLAIVGYAAVMGLVLRHSLTQRPPIPDRGIEPIQGSERTIGTENADGIARSAHPGRSFGLRFVPSSEKVTANADWVPTRGEALPGAVPPGSAGGRPGARAGAHPGTTVPVVHPLAHQGEFVDDLSVITPPITVRVYDM